METNYSEIKKYEQAQKKVEKIKAFYIHLVVFIFSMIIIVITNFMFVPGFHFFWFALLGWGMGIFIHWLTVFGFHSFLFSKNWEERKIQEYLKKEEKQYWE